MKKVTKYEADDGTLHDSAEAARKHESEVSLADWLNENQFRLADGEYSADDDRPEILLNWLKTNAVDLVFLLENYLNLRPRKANKGE